MTDRPAPPSTGTILLVDDSLINLRLLSDLLIEHHYTVRKATDGTLALQDVHRSSPDLILLDIMMPEMDGYEVCRQLKANPLTCQIPVIFLSSKDAVMDQVQAFELGGVDYITKPFRAPEVLVRVANQLKLRQLQQQVEQKNQQLQAQNLVLQAQNEQLQQEIQHRIEAEQALQTLNQVLEERINHRTLELQERNEQLIALQAQLQEVLAQEQALNDMKSELIATISHEFRTPLTVIATSTELLKYAKDRDCDPDAKSDRHYQNIVENVQRINQILTDALTLASATADHAPCQLTAVNLTDWCQAFIANWTLPEPSQHTLQFSESGRAPKQVWTDASLLQQILTHLIKNALRYSPDGGLVHLELIYQLKTVTFQVSDSGIGIPLEDQPYIFERFYRASNANLIPGTPGAGLGLSVVQWAVKKLQGSVSVTSVPQQGSMFRVTFPLHFT